MTNSPMMNPKSRVLLITLLCTVPSDLASKYWVDQQVGLGERVPIIGDFLYVTHVRNPGAALGMLAEGPEELRAIVFALVSILAVLVIGAFFRKLAPGDRFSPLALALVLGGAVGNFVDRILRGEVIDFIHVRLWGGYAWPDFNLADVFIVLGVAGLALELIAAEGAARAAPADADADR
ncbi:MAG: signal peptidase II [Deltaproteobacteria bacterium]|nr:signal peptidase II [Deltaproteobacteria bacterium]